MKLELNDEDRTEVLGWAKSLADDENMRTGKRCHVAIDQYGIIETLSDPLAGRPHVIRVCTVRWNKGVFIVSRASEFAHAVAEALVRAFQEIKVDARLSS